MEEEKNKEIVEKENPKGLGGWLILVGIGVVFSPIRIALEAWVEIVPFLEEGYWDVYTNPDSEYFNQKLTIIFIGEITSNLCMFVASFYIVYLFFSKHYRFPFYFIIIITVAWILVLIDGLIVSYALPELEVWGKETLGRLVRQLITALILVPYMLKSKRVKATFVEKMPNNEGENSKEKQD